MHLFLCTVFTFCSFNILQNLIYLEKRTKTPQRTYIFDWDTKK
jgi:hypothetical protein